MSKTYVVCFLLMGFAFSNQADAQLFRRWSTPAPASNYQRQYAQPGQNQNPNCQQRQQQAQQELYQQQAAQQRYQQPRFNSQVTQRQILEAQNELARQQRVVAKLQESMRERNFRSGQVPSVLLPGQQSQAGVKNPFSGKSEPNVAGQLVRMTNGKAGISTQRNQVDIARQRQRKMPVLAGPVNSVPVSRKSAPILTAPAPLLIVPAIVVAGPATAAETVTLIEPAVSTPVATIKDSQVAPVSGLILDGDSAKTISILETSTEPTGVERSVLEKATEEIGGLELNGPESGK